MSGEQIMDDLNLHLVGWAFGLVHMSDSDEDFEPFEKKWGGLDQKAFLRALHQGEGNDKLLAIFYLGERAMDVIKEVCLSLLHSTDPFERWASAIVLGRNQQEEALSVLIDALTEFPSQEVYIIPEETQSSSSENTNTQFDTQNKMLSQPPILERWRPLVIKTLRAWKQTVPAFIFQQALQQLLQQIHAGAPLRDWLYISLDNVTYALGQLEAFGALTGLDLSKLEIPVAMVYMVCGSLEASLTFYPSAVSNLLRDTPELRQRFDDVLGQRFALSKQQCQEVVDHFVPYATTRLKVSKR